ncbi:hypothetical protein B0H14DRAFT_2511182 [Mycena olivaceomarginata]|nr:hypothetical protein B0H14DRAFT_2511182 [Mycena olivaceomarginata]
MSSPLLLLALSFITRLLVSADTTPLPTVRSSNNNYLDLASKKFISDCSDQAFCSGTDIATATCVPHQCRRDEFPFGFAPGEVLPQLCPAGSFCPDDGSACRALVLTGAACELNRDEQCAPPTSGSTQNQNADRAICLRSECMYANATLGERCIADNTTYLDIGPEQRLVHMVTITRDNCQSPRFYCNPTTLLCEQTRPVGSLCQTDPECTSFNCNAGTCANPPETLLRVSPWQCALAATAIVAAMLGICTVQTARPSVCCITYCLGQSRELRDYYHQQISLRRSIIALHVAAVGRYMDEKGGSGVVG